MNETYKTRGQRIADGHEILSEGDRESLAKEIDAACSESAKVYADNLRNRGLIADGDTYRRDLAEKIYLLLLASEVPPGTTPQNMVDGAIAQADLFIAGLTKGND